MSRAEPPISVVVCSRDRPEALRRCLQSLAALDYPAYEVVLVDNASRDRAQAAALAAEFGARYLREERPGLDWARNSGAAAASHSIVAFTDDDVCADPGWLRGVALALSDPGVDAATGLVMPLELETEAQRLFEQYSGMGKGLAPRRFQRGGMRPRELIAAQAVGVGANMAFRRAALAAVGGFDTALDVGTPAAGAGDLDIFHRLLVAGLTIRYEPAALVRHQHRRDRAGLRRQLYSNGRSFGVYLLKIAVRGSAPRRDLADYALRWAGGWLLARLLGSLSGRLRFPADLSWAELWGALHAPWAYVATRRADRRVRAGASGPSAPKGWSPRSRGRRR